MKGYGHFYFIYNDTEIEEKVISSMSKIRLNYLVMRSIKLFDKYGEDIDTNWLQDAVEPLTNGNSTSLLELLQPGQIATEFEVEIVNPNQN